MVVEVAAPSTMSTMRASAVVIRRSPSVTSTNELSVLTHRSHKAIPLAQT